jgi:hypothetical protein
MEDAMRAFAFGFLIFVGPLFADCSCTGKSTDAIYNGGDGQPLLWKSMQRLLQGGSPRNPLYCYERQVENKSDRDVTDVFWKVAGFEKDLIPRKDFRCDASSLFGNLKHPDPTGPLYYNVSSKPYGTTSYSPEGGYPTASARIFSKPEGTPELTSTIQVTVRPTVGRPTASTVSFRSSVRTLGRENQFEYELITSGSDKLLVYWNVPLTADFRTLEMGRNSLISLVPGAKVQKSARSVDPIGWTPAAVQIFDYQRRWLGTGIAAVYCSVNGKPEPPLEQPQPRN